MKDIRFMYQPIIAKLQTRIDHASRDWVVTGSDRALHEYNMLIQEMTEIKETILKNEARA